MAHSKDAEARLGWMRLKSTTRLTLGLLLALGGCSSVPDWANPVEWYRDATGVSKNDPTGEERNAQNLEQGGKEPYPNLASVPSAPTNALSADERDKLRRSLGADQANAKYLENSDQYVAVPPTASSSPTSPRPASTPTPPAPTPPAPTPQAPSPPAPTPQASSRPAPAPPAPSPRTPPPPAVAPAPPAPQSSAAPPPSPPALTPAPTPNAGSSGTPIPQGPAALRAPVRGSETPPRESPLVSPSVRSIPEGETPRAAPPPPPGGRTPAPPAAPPTPPQSAALPPPSNAPAPTPAAPSGAGAPAVTVTVGSIELQVGNKISPSDLQQLQNIVRLRQQNGGTIRVTGYSVLGPGSDLTSRQMSGFGAALDRAKTVALALTQAGAPARNVAVGAVPAPPGQSPNVVDITLEY